MTLYSFCVGSITMLIPMFVLAFIGEKPRRIQDVYTSTFETQDPDLYRLVEMLAWGSATATFVMCVHLYVQYNKVLKGEANPRGAPANTRKESISLAEGDVQEGVASPRGPDRRDPFQEQVISAATAASTPQATTTDGGGVAENKETNANETNQKNNDNTNKTTDGETKPETGLYLLGFCVSFIFYSFIFCFWLCVFILYCEIAQRREVIV